MAMKMRGASGSSETYLAPSSGAVNQISALHLTDSRTNQSYDIPIQSGGYLDAADLGNIKNSQGKSLFVYDEGSRHTACIKSAVSYLNGTSGKLQYRQYAIEDLFGDCTFADNVHLQVYGSLPNSEQRESLDKAFAQSMLEQLDALMVIRSFQKDSPMMTMIMGGLSACAALHPEFIPVHEDKDVYGDASSFDTHLVRTLAAFAVAVAGSYCHQHSLNFRQPRLDLSYIENMLLMMNFVPANSDEPDASQARYLDDLVMLLSEHGTCNATVAFLHTASTRADPISSLLSGLASLYGPLHGGSNMVTYRQLHKIGTVDNIGPLINNVKHRKQRLYGFGHRIYRAIDPRATLFKHFLRDRAAEGIKMSPCFDVAMELERVVETDSYFVSRNLKANTDLYSVLAYKSIGIPEVLAFPLICIGRAVGFMAHWREQLATSPTPWRPQQIYTGPPVQRHTKI